MIFTDSNSNTNNEKIIVVIVIGIILLVLFISLFLVYPLIKKKYMYRNFRLIYYKKIHEIAIKNDYFLLNNIVLKSDNDLTIAHIDHIIFASKYIYVIRDRYFKGALSGEKDDSVWLFSNKKIDREEIENPLIKNKKRIEKLCETSNISEDLIVSIVLVNNDCLIKNKQVLNSKKSYIVHLKELSSLIKRIEKKSKVNDIDQESLEKFVKDIYKLYGNGKEEREHNEGEL